MSSLTNLVSKTIQSKSNQGANNHGGSLTILPTTISYLKSINFLIPIKYAKWEISLLHANVMHAYWGEKTVSLWFCTYILTEFTCLPFFPPFHSYPTFSLLVICIGSVFKHIPIPSYCTLGLSYHLLYLLIVLPRIFVRTRRIKSTKQIRSQLSSAQEPPTVSKAIRIKLPNFYISL